MQTLINVLRGTPATLKVYWMLARIIIPITILTEVLLRLGLIEAIAPIFSPVMNVVGLPSELGLAWLTAMIVGMWGAVPLIFALVPISTLSVADVTVFSTLILFAHGLPIEQKIIQKVGPGFIVTTTLRILGGLLYAFILHRILVYTNWLSAPVDPVWIPMGDTQNWLEFFLGLAEAMAWMLVVLIVLSWSIELLKLTGLLDRLMIIIAPVLRLGGVEKEAGHLSVVGLFLGLSFGAGLLIQEAKSGLVSPRQLFLSCVLMGFAHSIIEDTIVVMALGADIYGVLVGRIIFALAATATIAALIKHMSDKTFHSLLFPIKQ